MSDTPIRINFNVETNQLVDNTGQPIGKNELKPDVYLTQKPLLNIQLVTDEDLTKFTDLESGSTADFRVDDDFSNPALVREFATGNSNWIASATANEYYYYRALSDTPVTLYENSVIMTKGTAGSLAVSEWDLSDNDSIGEDRIYVRLSDNTDPDTKATGYLQYKYADGKFTPLFIYSNDFNVAGSWYDEDTETFGDPDITQGQITFSISANTENYADRLGTEAQNLNTFAMVPIFSPTSSDIIKLFQFEFFCRNILLPDDQIELDITAINVYTKTEVDAITEGIRIKAVSVYDSGTSYSIDDFCHDVGLIYKSLVNSNQGNTPASSPTEWEEYSPGGAGSGDVVGPASSADNALARFDGTTGKLLQNGQTIEDDSGNVTTGGNITSGGDIDSTNDVNVGNDLDVTNNALVGGTLGSTGLITASAGVDASGGNVTVTDEAYGPTWDESVQAPTKNAVYDEMETKQPKDLSGEVIKATLTGPERFPIDDEGEYKYTTSQAIKTFAIDDLEIEVDYGWFRDSGEYGNLADGIHGTFQRAKTTADDYVMALLHCDGSTGDSTFTDDSTYGLTVTNIGSPTIVEVGATGDYANFLKYNSYAALSAGRFKFNPSSNWGSGTDDFAFFCLFGLGNVNLFDYLPIFYYGTGDGTNEIMQVYLNNGFLNYKIGTTEGTGDWTDQDSVEVINSGYVPSFTQFNTLIFQRNGDELQLGVNGNVIARLSMDGKTLNTPLTGTEFHIGYDLDSGGNPNNLYDRAMDEIVLTSGVNSTLIDITPNQPTPTTYEDITTEFYVTTKYDIDPNATEGSYRRFFDDSDLVGGVLTVNHNLNQTVVVVAVYGGDDKQVIPDEVELVDTDSLKIDLSSYGTLGTTYRLIVLSGRNNGGGSGSSGTSRFYEGYAVSDETTPLTTGTAKLTFRMPYAVTLTEVRASVTTAPTGANIIVDINESGSSILSPKLSIDAGEKTSTTAVTTVGISDPNLADDAEITIDIDQVGSTVAGTGLKVRLIGTIV